MFSFSLSPISCEVRCLTETFHPIHHQFRPLQQPVDPGQFPSQRWWPGVRRVSPLASPIFIALAASTLSLHNDILTDCNESGNNLSRLTCWLSQRILVMLRMSYPPNNLSGTALVCSQENAMVEASLNSANHRAVCISL